MTPLPPEYWPLPPESGRYENSRRMTGYRRSRISGSVIRYTRVSKVDTNRKADLLCWSCGNWVNERDPPGLKKRDLLDSTGAVPSWSSTTSTGDRLVIAPSLLHFARHRVFAAHTEGQVVAASLTGCTSVESFEHDIGDSLGSKDVAGTDGRFRRRVQQAFLGYADCVYQYTDLGDAGCVDSLSRGTRHPALSGISWLTMARMLLDQLCLQ